MRRTRGSSAAAAALLAALVGASPAYADIPQDGALGFQAPATPAMHQIVDFHDKLLMPIITAVSVLVLALLLWVMIRYNRRANPTPKKFTHNMFVEVLWTIIPVLILVVIAIRSFPILYAQERAPPAEMTIVVKGSSWAWTYDYQDMGVSFTAIPLEEADADAQNRPYLLAADNPVYVPVGTNIQLLITSNDVIHSWTVPAFGVKQDAIPGRTNVGWINVERPGTYYGQCSELCGINHAFMPIEVRAVPRAEFDRWVVAQGGTLTPEASPARANPTDTQPNPLNEQPPPAPTPAAPAPTP